MAGELERSRPRVLPLKETADQLLSNTDSREALEAKEKLHIIANRLKSLLKLCNLYIGKIEGALDLQQEAVRRN